MQYAMDEPYMIDRQAAAHRYGLGQRTFDDLYRRNEDFPVVRVGKKVMVLVEQADAWFARNIREVIETE